MGIIRKQVTVCPVVRVEGKTAPGSCQVLNAAFDTGAVNTMLHPKFAPSKDFPRGPSEEAVGIGQKSYPTTNAFVQAAGCANIQLTPWVGADLPNALGVDLVIGHDYMERARLIPVPETGEIHCRGSVSEFVKKTAKRSKPLTGPKKPKKRRRR